MKYYVIYLKKVGVNIQGIPNYIDKSVYFDSSDFSKINLYNNVTLSKDVMLLTHDGSLHTAYNNLELSNHDILKKLDKKNNLMLIDGISIGANTFIGARASLLPGTSIGENVIVGACAVVKGTIPDNSVVIGNPCRIICKTSDLIENKVF